MKKAIRYIIKVLFWASYLYRYWHFYTGQSSKDIYTIADAKMMNDSWLGFHTLDNEMAIDDLIELYKQQYFRFQITKHTSETTKHNLTGM